MRGHWYPQTKFLQDLVQYVESETESSQETLEAYVLSQLRQQQYPYILVDMILREGQLRRNGNYTKRNANNTTER